MDRYLRLRSRLAAFMQRKYARSHPVYLWNRLVIVKRIPLLLGTNSRALVQIIHKIRDIYVPNRAQRCRSDELYEIRLIASPRPPHPVPLPASSPWRACICSWLHPRADAAGEGTPPQRLRADSLSPWGRAGVRGSYELAPRRHGHARFQTAQSTAESTMAPAPAEYSGTVKPMLLWSKERSRSVFHVGLGGGECLDC